MRDPHAVSSSPLDYVVWSLVSQPTDVLLMAFLAWTYILVAGCVTVRLYFNVIQETANLKRSEEAWASSKARRSPITSPAASPNTSPTPSQTHKLQLDDH